MAQIPLLMISSGFTLLLIISVLILSSNTASAFLPQQPTAVQTSQITSQLNESTIQLSQQPTAVQTSQISLKELEGSEDFVASGVIDSVIYTINGNWEAVGNWKLIVSEGELTSFDTDMAWNNGTAAHTHEFQNFEMNDDSEDISVDNEGTVVIEGEMDVGTNGVVAWQNVPADINIQKAKIITVSLVDDKTNHHFGGQAVHGKVTSFDSCSVKPGADMQVPSGACG
ncbi:MAG: hypothetical protein WCB31_08545 [Nitrososphaeraceae archaeon]